MRPFDVSVNLELAFLEAGDDIESRVRAASKAGFGKVEMYYTKDRDVETLADVLVTEGVRMWTVFAGPRIDIADPSNHDEFLDLFLRTAADARTLQCPYVLVNGGMAIPDQRLSSQLGIVADLVSRAAELADDFDVTILVEAVNTDLHPGLLLSKTEHSSAVVRAVDSPRVRLLYDLYHSIVEGEDPTVIIPQVGDLLGHVQIADVPGRGEPGSGHVDWPASLQMLRAVGYHGVVGVECHPTRATPEALRYIRELAERL